jgi:hypothetical protein
MDNPVTSFSSGPYQSLDDAKLARSTIPQCPREPVAFEQVTGDRLHQLAAEIAGQ